MYVKSTLHFSRCTEEYNANLSQIPVFYTSKFFSNINYDINNVNINKLINIYLGKQFNYI